jgi:hypothetical protein
MTTVSDADTISIEQLPPNTLESVSADDPAVSQAVDAATAAAEAEEQQQEKSGISTSSTSSQKSGTSASSMTSAAAPAPAPSSKQREKKPPAPWKDPFKRSPNALYKFTNLLVHKLARIKNSAAPMTPPAPNAGGAGPTPLEQQICLLFSTEHKFSKDFKPSRVQTKDFARHAIPDMPGPCKDVFIHLPTVQLLQMINEHYGTCGMEFHKVPHPKIEGLWCISELFVFSGNEIAAEVKSPNKCAYCGAANAQRACDCEAVFFCSLACKDRATVDYVHTPADCDAALGRVLIQRSVLARKRMITIKEALEKDESLGKQIAVVEQRRLDDAKRDAEAQKQTADEYFRIKRARLDADSAKKRAELGMPIDPNIAPELQVGGAKHAEALATPLPDLPKYEPSATSSSSSSELRQPIKKGLSVVSVVK